MSGHALSNRHPINARGPTHLPPRKDLILIIRPIKLHRPRQLHLRELLGVPGRHRPGPHDADIPVDFPRVAHQARGLVGRQARLSTESARVPVDVVIPAVGAEVVVELADFDRSVPAAVVFELALFRELVAEVGQVERLDLARNVVENGRVWRLGRGAEDVAVGFGGVGLAGCLAVRFVGAPVGLLAVSAAVFGCVASAAFSGPWCRARGVGADVCHISRILATNVWYGTSV